jgi:ATP-binding protein involved in chromosome partitioning
MFGTRLLRHQNPLGLPMKSKLQPIPGKMAQGLPQKRRIPGISKTVLVSSAKGGVGKSTTSGTFTFDSLIVNLAVAFASQGLRAGLLDADLYGPSIPRMMNLSGEPDLDEKTSKLIPLSSYGVKCMSMGFLVGEQDPVVWRGMMVMKAIQQLVWDVQWGELDVLVIGIFMFYL